MSSWRELQAQVTYTVVCTYLRVLNRVLLEPQLDVLVELIRTEPLLAAQMHQHLAQLRLLQRLVLVLRSRFE